MPRVRHAEFSVRAVALGAVLGVVFGLVTVYIALRVGLNFSASIPIAVIAITLFKRLGRPSVLEQNIVQTVGSAGESILAGQFADLEEPTNALTLAVGASPENLANQAIEGLGLTPVA